MYTKDSFIFDSQITINTNAQGNKIMTIIMKMSTVLAKIRENAGLTSMHDETVMITFYGLGEACMRINARDLAARGSIGEWLEKSAKLPEGIVYDILNRDYEYADFDGEIVSNIASGLYLDLDELQAAYELADDLGDEVVSAGLACDIQVDKIAEMYCGRYDNDEAFAEDSFREVNEIPSHLEFYIDWDKVTRDFMMDTFSSNGHYFDKSR